MGNRIMKTGRETRTRGASLSSLSFCFPLFCSPSPFTYEEGEREATRDGQAARRAQRGWQIPSSLTRRADMPTHARVAQDVLAIQALQSPRAVAELLDRGLEAVQHRKVQIRQRRFFVVLDV